MELKSDPKFDTINVTDIDIAFPGDLQTFTLRDGVDHYTYVQNGAAILLTFATGGWIKFHLQHAHYIAERQRTIRVAIAPDALKAKEQAAHADERTPDAL